MHACMYGGWMHGWMALMNRWMDGMQEFFREKFADPREK